MKTEKSPLRLTEGQRRSLCAGLQIIEEKLRILKLLAENGSYSGEMFRLQMDLDDQDLQQLARVRTNILGHIRVIKEELHLPSSNNRFSDSIRATEGYLWAMLRDEMSDKLKRYGKVDQNLSAVLDPEIRRIIEQLNRLSRMVSAPDKRD